MVKPSPLSLLWVGRCNVYEYRDVTDPETHQTHQELTQIISDEPCRLSQNNVSNSHVDIVKSNNGVPYIDRLVVIFIRPDLDIKAGSVIEVTQHGRTDKYKRAGKPAVYSNHQEIVLELYEDKA